MAPVRGSDLSGVTFNFGNDFLGGELSGGPTFAGGDYNLEGSTISGEYSGGVKAGVGFGVEASIEVNPSAGSFDLTLGAAAGLKASVTVTFSLTGISLKSAELGVGVIVGAFVDTPIGGVGLAADGLLGVKVEDGILRSGLSGEVKGGTLIVDGTLKAHAGGAADFGSLTDPDGGYNGNNLVSRAYGSAIVPRDQFSAQYDPLVGDN